MLLFAERSIELVDCVTIAWNFKPSRFTNDSDFNRSIPIVWYARPVAVTAGVWCAQARSRNRSKSPGVLARTERMGFGRALRLPVTNKVCRQRTNNSWRAVEKPTENHGRTGGPDGAIRVGRNTKNNARGFRSRCRRLAAAAPSGVKSKRTTRCAYNSGQGTAVRRDFLFGRKK